MNQRTWIIILTGIIFLVLFSGHDNLVAKSGSSSMPGGQIIVLVDDELPTTTSKAAATEAATSTATDTIASTPAATNTPTTTSAVTGMLAVMPTPATMPSATPQVPVKTSPRDYYTALPDMPRFYAERWSADPGDGYLFVSMFAPVRRDQMSFNMILDDNGEPVYYQPLTTITSSNDFKKQPNGLLTYFAPVSADNVSYAALNNKYQLVKEYRAANDPETGQEYTIDNHDMQILENGNALILIHDTKTIDMSRMAPGGSEEASVIGCVIQEIDEDNNVVFQWRSWDYIDIRDTVVPLDNDPLRYVHCNSIEEDNDGNFLLGSRNLNEITKIDSQTGEIIWRMGGRHNEFDFDIFSRFSFQHDVRRLPNGHLTAYDNAIEGARFSRGVEYAVDENTKFVEEVADFENTPQTHGKFMGNMQRLPNGNTLIGWGTSSWPVLTEFDAQGEKILELSNDANLVSYRAFRFPWQGYPTWPPALAARMEGNRVHLHFSWNGSTETVAYLINAGRTLEGILPLAKVERNGFETTFSYDLPEDGFWYFRVRPIDGNGVVGRRSDYVIVVSGGDTVHMPLVIAE